jgi:hypothetical protein
MIPREKMTNEPTITMTLTDFLEIIEGLKQPLPEGRLNDLMTEEAEHQEYENREIGRGL